MKKQQDHACHSDHNEHEACECDCGHECHEDTKECGCSCGHEHHEDAKECGCGCGHEGHENADGCGCGCSHGQKKSSRLRTVKYILGATLLITAFLPFVPNIIGLVLSAAVYAAFGVEVFRGMIGGFAKKKIFTEFTLMCAASIGAFLLGEYAEAAAIVYLYSLGELLSDTLYIRSKRNISELTELMPDYVMKLENGSLIRVTPSQISIGDRFIVNAGERVAIDGAVEEGSADADTSSVTGEAMPLSLEKDVLCPSGSVILNGSVVMRAVADQDSSVISRLARAVEEASKRKARTEKRISRLARVMTPLSFGLAAIIAAVGSALTGNAALWIRSGLSLLVVSCPCALLLSVPLTYFAGIGRAAGSGIVFRGGETADALSRTGAAVFDKTGTLTEATLSPSGIETYNGVDTEEFIALAANVLKHSPHAAARSFCAINSANDNIKIENVGIIGGRGIVCHADGVRTAFGNAALMRDMGIDVADSRITSVFGASEGVLLGRIDFSSEVKTGAAETLRRLRKMGVRRIAVISGDGEDAVMEVCNKLGIKEYYHSVAPHRKAELLERIMSEERAKNKKKTVLYCGDGLNDSAVISVADVGAAMGKQGAALTVQSADVVLADDNIERLADALQISRRISRIAVQNIALSLGIKAAVLALGIALSCLGLEAPLGLAVVADVGASLLAVLNATRAAERKKQ